MCAEKERLRLAHSRQENWQRWGPYLPERQWGTVREDYSAKGDSWAYFPFEHSHLRAYRWGEDGLLGFTDRECRLCFSVALWNGCDPILKERLYGLNNHQGNHGEDVKELYYYQDATPTYSYCKATYRYPLQEFPYKKLQTENKLRGLRFPEYELGDTGILAEDSFADIIVEYAKAGTDDILIQITVNNHSAETADIHLLPTLWFRNTWIWGCRHEGCWMKPSIIQTGDAQVRCTHQKLEPFIFEAEGMDGGNPPSFLFTENETNTLALYGSDNYTPYVKDAFNRYIVSGQKDAVSPKPQGTKMAVPYHVSLTGGESKTLRLRLYSEATVLEETFGESFEDIMDCRRKECEAFYGTVIPETASEDEQAVMRQSYAGLLWSKQFYHYVVDDWLEGDIDQPAPPPERLEGRNSDWRHLFNRDIISVPDKWEYPWYASWDLAFHMIPFSHIDPEFSKAQLLLFLREWYMHPNGQVPAYEWALDDVNPPVHAWAAFAVYRESGNTDRVFLKRVFEKLLMNFTWWVNRKDPDGNHIFSGGFLGMDNIGVFNRSDDLPEGEELCQADATAWMAFYCTTMLNIALELGKNDAAAADMASKFFEHFIAIADAINSDQDYGLWDDVDGFYYDELTVEDKRVSLRVRSLVGLIPILAVNSLCEDQLKKLPEFYKRMNWFLDHRKDLCEVSTIMATEESDCGGKKRLLAIPSKARLKRVLTYLVDENEFLSQYGIRSLSRYYEKNPYIFKMAGKEYRVQYSPAEAHSDMFGGNSNWRGPIWLPINFLIIDALRTYHAFYGDDFTIECPAGSGSMLNLGSVADVIQQRVCRLFLPDSSGIIPSQIKRPNGVTQTAWGDDILFFEYFNPETGEGVGASHQTGWTALVAELMRSQR